MDGVAYEVSGAFLALGSLGHGPNMAWTTREGETRREMLTFALEGFIVAAALIYGVVAQARFGGRRLAVVLAIMALLVSGISLWLLI